MSARAVIHVSCVCCAGRGDIEFQLYKEVRDQTTTGEYFLDARCVAVGDNKSVVDIEWFRNRAPINPELYVPSRYSTIFNHLIISSFGNGRCKQLFAVAY